MKFFLFRVNLIHHKKISPKKNYSGRRCTLIHIYIYIYSRRHKLMRLAFFIILYPYFTLNGLIFILEVKFQSFLEDPTHMPDLSSEEFDLSAKKIGNWSNFPKTWFLPFWPHFDLNKNEICAFRDTIFWEPFLLTSRKLIWRGH